MVSRVEAVQRNPLLNSGNGSYSCESITQIHKVKPANDKMNSQKNLLQIWGIKACGSALLFQSIKTISYFRCLKVKK